MKKDAYISTCQKYRYWLLRQWDDTLPMVMFIMLNPSTADAEDDDPTIRRCIGFAKAWGYGGLYVCNLFAYRTTNPKVLLTVDNPFGDENIYQIRQLCSRNITVVSAWGNERVTKKILKDTHPTELIYFIRNLCYIELSKSGTPKHPLYLKSINTIHQWHLTNKTSKKQ